MADNTTNMTETLTDMYSGLNELADSFKQRSETVHNILTLFLDVIKDDQSSIELSHNKSLRKGLKENVENVFELTNEYDPIYLNKLQSIQSMCALSVKQIELANKEGVKII